MASRGKDKALKAVVEAEVRFATQLALTNSGMEEALKAHLAEREPLLQRRCELVSGASEPTAAELAGYKGPVPEKGGAKGKGLPCFWLHVLRSQDLIAPSITSRDAKALAHLEDVRFVRGLRGLLVEFVFRENPYFENKVLRRGVYLELDAHGQPFNVREEATEIAWKDGACLLVREVRRNKGKKGKKAKKGKKGSAAAEEEDAEEGGRRRFKACPSFFRFFTPLSAPGGARAKVIDPTAADEDDDDPTADLEHEEEEEAEEEAGEEGAPGGSKAEAALNLRRQADGDMLEVLVKRVIPKAMHLYLEGGAANQGAQAESEEDDDDEEGFEMVSGSLRGTHGGDVSSLPPHAQQLVHALKGIQDELDKLILSFKSTKWDIKAKLEKGIQQLADERKGFVAGPDPSAAPAVPNFWLRVLRGLDSGLDCVHRRDEKALSYISDVRLCWDFSKPMPTPEQPSRYATLELHFRSGNPFFSNPVLRKQYTFQGANASVSRVALVNSEVLDAPDWAEGKDLTVKAVPGGEGKTKPAASFFALFKKGALRQAFNIVGEDRQSQQEAIRMEEALLNEISGALMQRAFAFYDMVDLDDELPEEDEEDESEEEEEEEEEEGDEDGETKAARRRSRRAAARRGSRPAGSGAGGSGAVETFEDIKAKVLSSPLLMMLLLVVGLAQAFAVMEIVPQVRAWLGYS